MLRKLSAIIIVSVGMLSWYFFAVAGTISDPYEYAWSNNVGYVNFEDVVVNDNNLSGYAWAANAGWINFAPAQGGVMNDGQGHLSGYAWGENLGWIDFSGVTINPATGKFSGSATGALVGTITFDCAYCDVQTDWRPSNNEISGISFTNGGSFFASPEVAIFSNQTPSPAVPRNIVAVNAPVPSSPNQTKILTVSGGRAPNLPIFGTTSTSTKIVKNNSGTAASTSQKNIANNKLLIIILLFASLFIILFYVIVK